MESETIGQQYSRLWQEAGTINERMEAINHPCTPGNGICCENPKIDITVLDFEKAKALVLMGIISKEIVEAAASRIGGVACPFFDPADRLCTLRNDELGYNAQPLICKDTGMPAIVTTEGVEALAKKNPKAARDLIRDAERGTLKEAPLFACQSTMCSSCHEQLEQSNHQVKIEEIVHAEEVHVFRHTHNWGTTTRMARELESLV